MKPEIRAAVIVGGVIASGLVFLLFIPAEGLPTQNAPVFFAAALAVNASILIAVEISGSALPPGKALLYSRPGTGIEMGTPRRI